MIEGAGMVDSNNLVTYLNFTVIETFMMIQLFDIVVSEVTGITS
jgi:hypothetical protein